VNLKISFIIDVVGNTSKITRGNSELKKFRQFAGNIKEIVKK